MKAIKKLSKVILIAMLCISITKTSFAAMETQDGLQVTLSTDKEEYEREEQITAILKVTNTNNTTINKVTLETFIPKGYSLTNYSPVSSKYIESLKSGETMTLSISLQAINETVIKSSDDSSEKISTEIKEDNLTPNTKDTSKIFIWIAVLLISLLGVILILKAGNKKIKKGISTMLIGIIFFNIIFETNIYANTIDVTQKQIYLKKNVLVGGTDIMLQASVTYAVLENDNIDSTNAYTITFESLGGSKVENQIVEEGRTIIKPISPTKNGCIFNGWYTDENYTDYFDFDERTINTDITLFARWFEYSNTMDEDSDGIPDVLEELLGTDKTNVDTDNDGLSDYIEINLLSMDPLREDTDSNGIPDSYEDSDNDGLTNLEEIRLGTNPMMNDSDNDGLDDAEELRNYSTDPQNADTDGDGVSDGKEIELGTDPLTAQGTFEVKVFAKEEDNVIVSVDTKLKGDLVETLSVTQVTNNNFFNEDMPGYIGAAYDFYVDGNFESATISFEFEPKLLLDENFVPVIYYFNESTQMIEALDTTIKGNIASAVVSHFSTYILLNKSEVEMVWDEEILPPGETDSNDSVIEIVYVIDYSASMNSNDPEYLRLDIVNQFIKKLRDNQDRASVVKFAAYATTLVPLSTDKEMLTNAVNGIVNASDNGCDSEAGTNGTDGLHAALEQLKNSDGDYKYIIFLTDGEDTTSSYSYDELIKVAVQYGVKIYSVGMGEADESLLTNIAASTDGKYYFASNVDIDDDSDENLMGIFNDIENNTIDRELDSNNDGISNYYTKLLCEGKIVLGTGKANPFSGISYELVQANDDYDGDGLKNGEEIIVTSNDTYVYVKMKSNPALIDSDGDGLYDNQSRTADITISNGKKIKSTIAPADPEPLTYNGPKGMWEYHIDQMTRGTISTEYSNGDGLEFLSYLPKPVADFVVESIVKLNDPLLDNEEFIRNIVMAVKWCSETAWRYSSIAQELSSSLGAYILNFISDNEGVAYHSQPDTWQRKFGYNEFYDNVFRVGSFMDFDKVVFNANGERYALWLWKGDYWNLHSGAEIGLYKYRTNNSSDNMELYDAIDFELPMKLSLYYYYTSKDIKQVFSWAPVIKQWWITGFNASEEFQNPKNTPMVSVGTIDFTEYESMFNGLKTAIDSDFKNFKDYVIFDEDNHTLWIMWDVRK